MKTLSIPNTCNEYIERQKIRRIVSSVNLEFVIKGIMIVVVGPLRKIVPSCLEIHGERVYHGNIN